MLTILPRERAIIPRATACVTKNTESRLVAMISRQSASAKSTIGARLVMPALFTRMSIGPMSFSICATDASTVCFLVTSKGAAMAFAPIAFTVAATAAASLPLMITRAPAAT